MATSYPIRLTGAPPPPPPSSSSSRTKKSVKQAQQQQQRHVITVTPTLTLPQLRLDASRLFSVSLDYNVQFLVGYPPKPLENLIGDTGDGDDKLVRDFVGRNESVTVRFVPDPDGNSGASGSNGTGPKKEKKKKKTAGKATEEASTDDKSAPTRTSSGKKRSRRPAAAAEAGGDSSDEYQYEDNDDEDDDDNDITGASSSSSSSTTGRRSKRAASAAATAAMPDVIAAQERMMAQNGGGGTKKSKKSATTTSGNATPRAAAAEKRAAAAASRRMAAMPGRRLVDGTDVAPTASRSPSAASRKRTSGGGTGSSSLFGNMSSEDDVSYSLMSSLSAAGGGGGGGGGGKIGRVLRGAMNNAVGKSYEQSRAVVRVDAVRGKKFRIVAKSTAGGGRLGGGDGDDSTSSGGAANVGMYAVTYSKGVEGRGEYEEDVEIIGLDALRAVVTAVHADHSVDPPESSSSSAEGGGGGGGREMLRPVSMAQLSPRVFWSLAHHFPNCASTEDALQELLPDLDWTFLNVRSRMLSEKARENIRQEKIAKGEIVDEDEYAAANEAEYVKGAEAVEAVEKAMEEMADQDRANARERAARAALARFGGEPTAVNTVTGREESTTPGEDSWALVTPTDEDEDELAECIREGFGSAPTPFEPSESDIKKWISVLMKVCSVHNWRELANIADGAALSSSFGGTDRPTEVDIDGWIESARTRSVEEIMLEIVDGNEEAYVALRDAARAGTPKDLCAWRAMADMLLEEVSGFDGADVKEVGVSDVQRWCNRAGVAMQAAEWLIWYATPIA